MMRRSEGCSILDRDVLAELDRAAAGVELDEHNARVVHAEQRRQWHATYELSCGHGVTDGLREDEAGRLCCSRLDCGGLVVARRTE